MIVDAHCTCVSQINRKQQYFSLYAKCHYILYSLDILFIWIITRWQHNNAFVLFGEIHLKCQLLMQMHLKVDVRLLINNIPSNKYFDLFFFKRCPYVLFLPFHETMLLGFRSKLHLLYLAVVTSCNSITLYLRQCFIELHCVLIFIFTYSIDCPRSFDVHTTYSGTAG